MARYDSGYTMLEELLILFDHGFSIVPATFQLLLMDADDSDLHAALEQCYTIDRWSYGGEPSFFFKILSIADIAPRAVLLSVAKC